MKKASFDMRYNVRETHSFKKDVKRFSKRYPSLKGIIVDLFKELEKGNLIGTHIITLKGNDKIYKVREANPDARKGKSRGFRIVYYLVTESDLVFPLALYSKGDSENLSDRDIREIAKELNL